jgi:hypothetical protein
VLRDGFLVARPRLRAAAGERAQVRAAGALEEHRRHHAADDVAPAGDDAVVEHERGISFADRSCNVAAQLARRDQVAGLREACDVRRDEERRFVRDRPQRLVRGGERDGPRRVGVDDTVDVVPRPHQFRMDRILDVPPALALEHLAVPRDEQHLFRAHLLQAPRRRLHPDAAAVGVARRDVTPDEVALVLEAEDAAAERDLLAKLLHQ